MFVKSIMPGSAADRDGRLRPRDQILEVNKQSLENFRKQEVAALLMSTRGPVSFRLQRTTLEEDGRAPLSNGQGSPAPSTELPSSDEDSDNEYPVEVYDSFTHF